MHNGSPEAFLKPASSPGSPRRRSADGDATRSRRQSSASGAGDLTCAVCLEEIPLEDMAIVKGCEHIYCGAHPQ